MSIRSDFVCLFNCVHRRKVYLKDKIVLKVTVFFIFISMSSSSAICTFFLQILQNLKRTYTVVVCFIYLMHLDDVNFSQYFVCVYEVIRIYGYLLFVLILISNYFCLVLVFFFILFLFFCLLFFGDGEMSSKRQKRMDTNIVIISTVALTQFLFDRLMVKLYLND